MRDGGRGGRSRILVIFTKVPIAGLTKTRLAPSLSFEAAAALHRAFLRDVLDRTAAIPGIDRVVAYTPAGALPVLRGMVREPLRLVPQPEGDLGQRMSRTFEALLTQGGRPVVLIGSDSPTLPAGYIAKAFRLLERDDVVVGPSSDGGYYLIGMTRPHEALFQGISWGTDRVFGQTVDRIRGLGLSLGCLDPWYDVDTSEDLAFLASHLDMLVRAGAGGLPRATVGVLRELGMLGGNAP